MLYTFNQYTKCACRDSYLGNGQLQLHHVFWLGHRGLESRVQKKDPIQVLPTANGVIVHKQHLIHGWEVLTPHPAPRFSCHKTHIEGERVIISAQCQYLDALLH